MRKFIEATLVAATAGMLAYPIAAQFAPQTSLSFVRRDGAWAGVPLVCDGTNRDHVLIVGPTGRGRQVELAMLAKPGLATQRMAATIGPGEPGMGQIYYPLRDAAGRDIGEIRAVNPGMVEPGATTPAVTSIRLGRETTNCRFAPQTRVLGATLRRSIQIVRTERQGYRYTSYDYDTVLPEVDAPWGGRDTRASLTIDGGRVIDRSDGRRVYLFVNRGVAYRVLASVDPARPGGGVEVSQNGRVILREPFGAYTAALAQ